MSIVTAWCHRCGKYVPVEIVDQCCVAEHRDDAGELVQNYHAALIQCVPHHHALLSVGIDDHGNV